MGWSEDRIHRWLAGRSRPASLAGSAGHDAAVLRQTPGRTVACCDQVVEGVHAPPGTGLGRLGAKAAARALSDLAATAAEPRALLCAVRAGQGHSDGDLKRLIAGVARQGELFGASLVGGDLSAANGPLSLTVTALGSLPGRQKAPGRDRAACGQRVLLTGPVGGSLLGRHLKIEPRIKAGQALWRGGATALMDVSDGLAWDMYRLARSSGVRITLEEVPMHRDARKASLASGRTILDHALHDGEDHELIATVPPGLVAGLLRENPDWSEVGRIGDGRGLYIGLEGARPRAWRPTEGGWKHGA